jgi:hypothetical protein
MRNHPDLVGGIIECPNCHHLFIELYEDSPDCLCGSVGSLGDCGCERNFVMGLDCRYLVYEGIVTVFGERELPQ